MSRWRVNLTSHERVMAHTWIGHGTYMNESWHTYWWVMAHILTSHCTHMNGVMSYTWVSYELWQRCWRANSTSRERVMAHTWMGHGTHMNESWHTYWWVMENVWMSHVTHMNGVMFHTWASHELWTRLHMNESWHTHEWVMAHTWISHGAHMNEAWHTYDWVISHIWMDLCLIHEWAMSYGIAVGARTRLHMNE